MIPHSALPAQPSCRIGVGIDTSRYGHYVAFLREDLQPAAPELTFAESAAGYAQLRARLEQIAQRHAAQGHAAVHFVVRLDAAGQYADNLLHFLHRLGTPDADAAPSRRADAAPLVHATCAVSCGDPQRNKNYRAALFGHKKSDPLEARAAARFALSERPAGALPLSAELRTLRQVAARLQAVVRQRTRLINQLHHLLALTFPELALLLKDIAAGWVLELLHRYPTAQLLAAAEPEQLAEVPYLPHQQIAPLLQHAAASIASLEGATVAELVRDQVRQLRDVQARQKRLEKLLVSAYHALPTPNHLSTIPGIGDVSAAVLTAFILDIQRFDTPGNLVAYFGVLPIEVASGVDRDGKPRGPKRFVMSRRGNDLVRRYLWMAALSAVRHNPAVRALYARVVAKHADKKAIAVGHAMRKLLHLVFAIWKTGKPFDPQHYPWELPTRGQGSEQSDQGRALATPEQGQEQEQEQEQALSKEQQAAGHTLVEPAEQVVTATCCPSLTQKVPDEQAVIDFAHLKRQLPIARVLDQLGLTSRLRGAGPQQRCTCPIHRGDARGRTFSVNLDEGVFQCFDAKCAAKGDIIDLWAAVKGLRLRDAALDLVATFGLESAPKKGTGKRNG